MSRYLTDVRFILVVRWIGQTCIWERPLVIGSSSFAEMRLDFAPNAVFWIYTALVRPINSMAAEDKGMYHWREEHRSYEGSRDDSVSTTSPSMHQWRLKCRKTWLMVDGNGPNKTCEYPQPRSVEELLMPIKKNTRLMTAQCCSLFDRRPPTNECASFD